MRRILITGASRGIGRKLVEHYSNKSYTVYGCSRSLAPFDVDVADEVNVRSMFSKIGQVDYLINCAGIAAMNHSLLTPLSTIQNIMNTNFMGTYLVSREAARRMKRGGRIVNFSTVAVPMLLEGEAVYAASKSAVETLTKIMAKELGGLGITVNCVAPTPIATDLIKNVPKDKIDAIIKRQAIKRMGRVEDVINVIDFFLQDASEFITGQTIYLGG